MIPQQLLLQRASMAPCDRITVEGWDDPRRSGQGGRKSRRRKHLSVRSPEELELHANVHVKAADRAGLERLCPYLARPAFPGDRLTQLPDGRIEFRLKEDLERGVLGRRCLQRRIPDRPTLSRQMAVWNRDRNVAGAGITWMVRFEDARTDLGKVYPDVATTRAAKAA